jgi:hypothetical protein
MIMLAARTIVMAIRIAGNHHYTTSCHPERSEGPAVCTQCNKSVADITSSSSRPERSEMEGSAVRRYHQNGCPYLGI